MKVFAIALFIFALAGVSMGQTSTASDNPADVKILRMKWSKLYGNTTSGNTLFDAGSKANPMTQTAVVGPGSVANQYPLAPFPPTSEDALLNNPRPGRGLVSKWRRPLVDGYTYQTTIENRGAKTVKAVNWEYVFTDAINQSVLARHSFYSKARIAPGRRRNLSQFAAAPPTRIVNAKAVAQNPQQPFTEQVLITRIEYTDGSVWERPSK